MRKTATITQEDIVKSAKITFDISLQIAQKFKRKLQVEEEKIERTKTELEQLYWREMTFEGTFVLLMSVDAYLTHDYEYCLRISTTDFSYVANSCIFESNILRVRALASIKHFEDELVNVNLKS